MVRRKRDNKREGKQLDLDLKLRQHTRFNEPSKIKLQISLCYTVILPQSEMQATLDRWL